MMPGGVQHPGEQSVLQRHLEEYLIREQFVTEERMRTVVNTVVRESMEEFHTSLRHIVEMVDRMKEMSSQFDTRANNASEAFTQAQARL